MGGSGRRGTAPPQPRPPRPRPPPPRPARLRSGLRPYRTLPPRSVHLRPAPHAATRSPLGRRPNLSPPAPAPTRSGRHRHPMAPKGKSGFFGVRAKPSGNFSMEFSDVGRRRWLDTYPTADEAARAYDVAVWRAGRPKTDLNFPEIETRAMAEWLVP
nr:ethylene-responsive transcription factor 2-like [Aegilops tauschii subsp. strangulata]